MTTYQYVARNKRRSLLLIFFFVIFVLFLGWVFSEALQYGPGALVLAAVISLVLALTSYYSGDKLALWTAGAVPIEKNAAPYVYRLVENLSITAGLPMPKVYIIPDETLNAFATGRDPQHASVAITSGLINALENEELEGVIAHELSHIQNYDIRVMTVVIICVGVVALLADWFLRASFFGFGGRRSNDRSSSQLTFVFVIIGMVLAILSPIIAQLIQLAVSRKREFLADASGALLTRYPEGLARALEKIAAGNTRPMRRANTATAHMYISNPFGKSGHRRFTTLFSTHPPIENRIQALRQMSS